MLHVLATAWVQYLVSDICRACRYTHLTSQELSRYLGCHVVDMDPWSLISLKRLYTPLPLSELASQEELVRWLSRILQSILAPGRLSQSMVERVYYPNNLVAFVDLLIHLHGVGFPSHWLSGFFASIIANTLASDVSPYLGILPIPSSERGRRVAPRRVNLRPWHADLENILAVSYEASSH